jgi:cysteine sulfinate desulfinase/cysteine desulfurase-like protein
VIYLGYNDATPVDPVAVEAMDPFLRQHFYFRHWLEQSIEGLRRAALERVIA